MSRDIYHSPQMHPIGYCPPNQPHPPQPQQPQVVHVAQAPMKTMTVGDAPVHIACEGVVIVEREDKLGRMICEYRVDPAFAADLTAQQICDAFGVMTTAQVLKVLASVVPNLATALDADETACADLAAGLISSETGNTIRQGSDGKLFENDAVI